MNAGFALSLIPAGCLASALGLLLMKSSAEFHAHLPAWRSWRWLLGFLFLGVVATAVDVTVLGVLPLSVVAPFAGLWDLWWSDMRHAFAGSRLLSSGSLKG